MQFYKSTEYGLLKVYPCKDGYIRGYIYGDEGHGEAIKIESRFIGESEAKQIKDYLLRHYDRKGISDGIIDF